MIQYIVIQQLFFLIEIRITQTCLNDLKLHRQLFQFSGKIILFITKFHSLWNFHISLIIEKFESLWFEIDIFWFLFYFITFNNTFNT